MQLSDWADGWVMFKVTVPGHGTAVEWHCLPDQQTPGAMLIENVNFRDFLDGFSHELKEVGASKGLPPNVGFYVLDRIKEYVRAAGFQSIHTQAPSNYMVMTLYRRALSFKPATARSTKMMDYIDELFKIARSELPEKFRIRNPAEFAKFLGSTETGDLVPASVNQAWSEFQKTKKLPDNYQLIRNRVGKILAVKTDTEQIYFINKLAPGNPLFDWNQIYLNSSDLELKLDLR